MKRYFFYILMLLLPQLCFGQAVVHHAVNALDVGDMASLARCSDKVIDVTLNNEQSSYSKSQAVQVLKGFWQQNNIQSFYVKHKGSATDGSSAYVIGDLVSKSGEKYRLYVFFKKKNSALLIQEIRISQ